MPVEQPTLGLVVADSLRQNGSAAAPGAGANFVSLAAPPAGVYTLRGSFSITGAVEVAAANVRLMANGAGFVDLPSAVGIAAALPFQIDRITLDGVNPVQLRAVAAATALTVYMGWLIASRIG